MNVKWSENLSIKIPVQKKNEQCSSLIMKCMRAFSASINLCHFVCSITLMCGEFIMSYVNRILFLNIDICYYHTVLKIFRAICLLEFLQYFAMILWIHPLRARLLKFTFKNLKGKRKKTNVLKQQWQLSSLERIFVQFDSCEVGKHSTFGDQSFFH